MAFDHRFKYKPLPSSPCGWSWDTGTNRIRQALGFQTSKIPAKFHGRFKVDGWNVVIKRGVAGGPKTAAHRIFIDNGGVLVPAGRLRQALCRVTLHKSRRRAAKQRSTGGRFTFRRR